MEVILLFILSGAVSWGLSALVLLAFLHALGRATANSMGLPHGGRPGIDVPPNGLPLPSGARAPWAPAAGTRGIAPGGELLTVAREQG